MPPDQSGIGSRLSGFMDLVRNRLGGFANVPAPDVGNLLQRFAQSEAQKLGNALQQTPTEDFLLRAPNALRQGFGDMSLSMGSGEAGRLALEFGLGGFSTTKFLPKKDLVKFLKRFTRLFQRFGLPSNEAARKAFSIVDDVDRAAARLSDEVRFPTSKEIANVRFDPTANVQGEILDRTMKEFFGGPGGMPTFTGAEKISPKSLLFGEARGFKSELERAMNDILDVTFTSGKMK